MHELSLCQSIIRLANRCAKQAGASQILEIALEIGEGMAVEPQTLNFCFDSITKGTMTEGARLTIDWVPLKLRCKACGAVYQASNANIPESCPTCGLYKTECLAGRDFQVKHIEVED